MKPGLLLPIIILFLPLPGTAQSGTNLFEAKREKAEQGDAVAQYKLGIAYAAGRGVPKDCGEAVEWWRKSAEQGYVVAQYRLGLAYENGTGVPKDVPEAIKWYRKAAEQGNASAQCTLGTIYSSGRGVPQDYAQAYAWWHTAAVQGDESAEAMRVNLHKRMTPEQVAEGKHLALEIAGRTTR